MKKKSYKQWLIENNIHKTIHTFRETGAVKVKLKDVFSQSFILHKGIVFFSSIINFSIHIIVCSKNPLRLALEGEDLEHKEMYYRICPHSPKNAATLRNTFLWTAPSPLGKNNSSLGMGDRLGLSSLGHLSAIENTKFTPVLAQQSLRELHLMGRTYQNIIDAASWLVFAYGYKKPWGQTEIT